MRTIKEIIVVEGRNDTNTLQRWFDCDTIETGGDRINPETITRIRQAQKTRGVIIFTDPDSPGEHIRRWINDQVPGCKQAFIEKAKARTKKKVGVEHAGKEDLEEALSHCVTFTDRGETITYAQFLDSGCIGRKALRFAVCETFHIGPCNAKTCFKRLNQMGITPDQLEKAVSQYAGNCDSQKNKRNSK